MPSNAIDAPINLGDGEDLYPSDPEDQRKLAAWVQQQFDQAESARKAHEERWLRFYKAYRSFVRKRRKGEWKSQVWMPISFYVIETILPRLAAQAPSAKVEPIGPEDIEPAELMEELLKWSEDKSELWPEQVKAMKSALIYGTGVLKISYGEKIGYNIITEPVVEETTTEVPTGELDIDGNPIMQTVPAGTQPVIDEKTGEPQMTTTRQEYFTYQGPIAQAVDIENFFPDPVCSDMDDARYVIHRVYRDKAHIEKKFKEGVYKKPADEAWASFLHEHATLKRLDAVELGDGDFTLGREKNLFPLLEFWTPDFMFTVAGDRGQGVLLRAERNPYAHGELPFVRVVDHLVPHEFWGIGELEPLEGIQDTLNAIWNARIDNVKLALNQMFAVVMDYMMDPSDLVVRPGGVIRMREGLPLNQVFQQIDLGEVTSSSYTEAAELEREGEKVTGVSPYQTGQDSPAYNRTATGVALISEQGNTRFSFKVTLAEHMGFKKLVRQYASILQQYVPDDLILRIKGGEAQQKMQFAMQEMQQQMQQQIQMGADPAQVQQQMQMAQQQMQAQFDPRGVWTPISQDAITGRFDFSIDAESSSQTISMRREQTLSLAQTAMADPYFRPRPIREDLLKEFGRKNVEEYLYSDMEIQMMQQAAAQQEQPQEGPPEGV